MIVFYIDGTAESYLYFEEQANGDDMFGSFRGTYTLRANGGLPVRKWGRIHGFYAIEGAMIIPGTPHVYSGAGDRELLMWDFTVDPGYDENLRPKSPLYLEQT